MKKRFFLMLVTMLLFLTGCTSVIELTSEEEDLIAEYAAGRFIYKYKESQGLLGSEEQTQQNVNEPIQTVPQQTQPATQPVTSQNGQQETESIPGNTSTDVQAQPSTGNGNIEAGLGITGVEMEMLGYMVVDKYPVEEYAFTVDAGNGYKLLVVEYDVWNSVDAQAVMKVANTNAKVKAMINSNTQVNVYKTLLNDDILNMDGKTFEAGEAVIGALIFRVKEEDASNITSVEINITE